MTERPTRAQQRLTRAQQQEVTRTRLLDAAETFFGDRGIHQTSLDEIAAAAGLTKGAIYANFGSKRELIAAILERKLSRDDGELHPHGGSLVDWVGQLGESYEGNVDLPEIRRFAMALIEFWLYGMRDETARTALAQWLRTARAAHAKEVAALAADLPMPPEQVAALVLALDVGITIQRLVDPDEVPAELYTAGLGAILKHDE